MTRFLDNPHAAFMACIAITGLWIICQSYAAMGDVHAIAAAVEVR